MNLSTASHAGVVDTWLPRLSLFALLAAITIIPISGRFRPCYVARFVGAAGNQLLVEEVKSNGRREPHTTADVPTMFDLSNWTAGDELLVCNAIVTNKTKRQSERCRDFGCLAIWP